MEEQKMNSSAMSVNETASVAALYQLRILDTVPEREFDDIAQLAALLCGTPMATIGFSDTGRLWFKARFGCSDHFTSIPGGLARCKKMHEGKNDVIVTEDVQGSERSGVSDTLVQEGIRFMASVPIDNGKGEHLGFLCVFDRKVRQLGAEPAKGLKMLAGQIRALLQLRLEKMRSSLAEYSEYEAHMRTLFQNAIDAVVVTDSAGTILHWNPKAEQMFGWKEEEALGKIFYELCIPDRYSDYDNSPENSTTDGHTHELNNTLEIHAQRKDGTELDIALGTSPAVIRDRTYYIHFISDITARKEATRELDKQKEFYENILNNIPTDIAVFDADHKYLFVNPGAIRNEELRRYIIGKDDFEYAAFRNRDRKGAEIRREKFLQAKAEAREIRWEDTMVSAEGLLLTHLRRMFPVHNESGELQMVIGFGIDITERKEMEEKQSALLKQLSVQNTQLTDFCNIVSHNLRAPVVNMSLLVDFIEACDEPDEQRLLISKMNPVLDALNTTFNELVESIQIKQDLEIRSEIVSLNDCLHRTLETLDTEITTTQATIESDFTETPYLYYPAKYINSIFQNLVSNALKYHSPKRKPVIRLVTKRRGSTVLLTVSDNGLGIDMVRHKDNFFKIGKVFHHHPNAKGFGLFMTKTHIESMGGRIWVESAPDKGATFFIEIINQHT